MHFDDLLMIVRGRQEDDIKVDSKVSSLGILGVGIHQQNKHNRSRIIEGK